MPEVKMRLRDLVNRFESINKLRNAPKIRAKLGFELAPLARQATDLVRAFEETRAKTVKGFQVAGQVPPEKVDELQDQINELLDAEVTLKSEIIGVPENFELDGLIAILADWSEFLRVKE